MKFYNFKRMIAILACFFCFPSLLSAQEPPKNVEEAVDAELAWLKAETVVMTELATKTSMDAELVPGMITVLQGKELEDRGIRTVYESLSLVPGLHTYISTTGDRQVSVRGFGGGFFSGNLKLMTDGVVMNDALTAGGHPIYDMPVSQIDRIEIIRGPGSVVYGDYAYAGVINVITRKNENRVYAYYDSNDGYGGGGNLRYTVPEKEFALNIGLSGFKTDGTDVKAGEDRLYEGFFGMQLGEFSNAPGPVNDAQKDKMANLLLQYGNFSLIGQYVSSGMGDYFGIINVLPSDEERTVMTREHSAVEAAQSMNFSDSFKADLKGGWRQFTLEYDRMEGLPPITGISLPDGSTMDITPYNGSLVSPGYEEREIYGSADFLFTGINRHTLLLGMKYSDTETEDVWMEVNTTEEQPGEMVLIRGEGNWLAEDQKRKVFSTYLQDMITVTEDVSVTLGLRYDHYSDMDEYLTPRLSAVWQPADHHIVKAQYSESFRPPTFTELYSKGNSAFAGNEDLDAAHIRSYELGYIYRNPKTTGRVTLFYSELEDNIEYPKYADPVDGNSIQYRNAQDTVKTKGFELEFQHALLDNLRLDGNLSFADTESETGDSLDGAADWLANLGLLYKPAQDYALSLQYRYVGKIHRTPDDSREDLKACNTLDLTVSRFHLFTKGLTLRAGISNLFDADIKNPAPVFKYQDGTVGYTYPDDFQRDGRKGWMQVSYDFD